MRLLTLLVGLPAWLKGMLSQEDRSKIGTPEDLKIFQSSSPPHYGEQLCASLLGAAADWVGERSLDDEFGLFIIYVNGGDGSETRLLNSFFPLCSAVGLDVDVANDTGNRARQAKNRVVREAIRLRSIHLSRAKAMRTHLISNARTTPLLLPLEKFHETGLAQSLEQLRAAGGGGDGFDRSIAAVRHHLGAQLPRQAYKNGSYFVARGLVFFPPGNQSQAPLHAVAIASADHPKKCLLAGRIRLGASFNPRFHYDCQPLTDQVAPSYTSCHGQPMVPGHRTHVNIAPNDFVR